MSKTSTVVVAESEGGFAKRMQPVVRRMPFAVSLSPVRERERLVPAIRSLRPTLVVLDFDFVKRDARRLFGEIRKASPMSNVLFVVDESKAASDLLDSGGLEPSDFLLRTCSNFELRRRATRLIRPEPEPPQHPLVAVEPPLPLRDPERGLLDAKLVADYLDVPLARLATALGENYKALHKTSAKLSVQEALLPIERAVAILQRRFLERARVRAWLNTPHPDLGRRTPLAVILEGHAVVVSDMLEAAEQGLPS